MSNISDGSHKRGETGDQLLQDDEAKLFLASIVNTMQDSVVTINLDGIITSWNRSAEKLYRYPATETIGKSLKMVLLPEDYAPLLDKIEDIIHGRVVTQFNTIRLQKGGTRVMMEIVLSPVLHRDGHVIGVSTLARDVTEIRKAEEALTSSEKHLRAVVESATDFAIVTIDSNGIIIGWSKGAHNMFGYEPSEAIGMHTRLIFTPEDVFGSIPEKEMDTARSTGRSIDERWHLHKDGTRFFMSGVMTPIDEESDLGFVKIARNITDRKLAEEALMLSEQRNSLAVQSAGMGEWEWEITSNQVTVSDQTSSLLGRQDGSRFQLDELLEQVYPTDVTEVKQELQAALDGLHIFQRDFRIVRFDTKETTWVSVYGRVVAHSDDGPLKMIGVIYDISSRKLLEKQKDDFISLASHELKTPITAIKAYADILAGNFEECSDDSNLSLLQKMSSQVDRLIRLIQMLLDSSSLTEGRITLYPQPLDMNSVIRDYEQLFQPGHGSDRLEVNLSQVGVVHADRERIVQVITNLVANALKYSPPDAKVILSTKDDLERLTVTIQDFGRGIPAEAQPYLFDRYYRVPNNQKRQDGFGLGLYICSQIIRQHHGDIGVESEPGKGSTFFFSLPYT